MEATQKNLWVKYGVKNTYKVIIRNYWFIFSQMNDEYLFVYIWIFVFLAFVTGLCCVFILNCDTFVLS